MLPLWISPVFLCVVSVLAEGSTRCLFHKDNVYEGTFANCARRNLSRIPTELPANTTSLDLRNNRIVVLSGPKQVCFTTLKYLDISHNSISEMKSDTFNSFHNLRVLYINNNKLNHSYSYPVDIFHPLQNLVKLHLQNNNMKFQYPDQAIGRLSALRELKIDTFSKTHFEVGFAMLHKLRQLILGFEGCMLQYIQNKTFENFENVPLVSVYLNGCPIANVDSGSFLPLKNLKYLYMSNTAQLETSTAALAMYGFQGRNISVIEMNALFRIVNFRNLEVSKRVLSNDVMVYLKNVCVQKFSMTYNNLLWFGNEICYGTVFSKCIRHLDLSMNDLYGDVTHIYGLSLLANLVYINASNHGRNRAFGHQNAQLGSSLVGITLPESLEVLDLNGFNTADSMSFFCPIHVYNATSLKYLSFANNGFWYEGIRITGLEDLISFDISGNNCSVVNPDFFRDFQKLESLTMANVNIGDKQLNKYGERLFFPMKKLKKVNLYNNDLRMLSPSMFSSNQLEEVVISRNRFEAVPFDLTTTPQLRFLDISFNSLSFLTDKEMELLDDLASRNNFTLNIEGNILSCGCHNLDFILWLYKTNVHVTGSTFLCQMTNGGLTDTQYIRDHYEGIWMSCNGRMSLSISIALFSVFILALVILYFTLRRKTLLVNIILRMFGYGSLSSSLTRTDFPNDAYICYSDADYQYICHIVRDYLENKHGLKLFIRDRDTIPGGQIADDIISGIDTSWRTILFFTSTFLDEQWCRFTINRVVYSASRRSDESVLLVLFDDVMIRDIDPALLNVVEERNIFYVHRYWGDEDRMWGEICDRIV